MATGEAIHATAMWLSLARKALKKYERYHRYREGRGTSSQGVVKHKILSYDEKSVYS